MGARDPYCGWDLLLKKCTTLEESVRMSQWEQSITKCPVSRFPIFTHIIVVHLERWQKFTRPTQVEAETLVKKNTVHRFNFFALLYLL